MVTCPIDCACHASPFAACSVPGGCGSAGCTQADTDCAACQKRPRDTGQVCDPCRRWLPVALASIPDLADRLHDELVPADDSTTQAALVCVGCGLTVAPDARPHHPDRPEHDYSPTGKWHGGWVPRRLVRRAAGPAPSIAPDIIVTGGADEAPVPIDLHIHDLLAGVVRDGGRPIDATGDNWIPASVLTPVIVNHTRFEAHDRREQHDDGTVTLHRDFRHVREQLTVMDRRTRRDHNGRRVMIPAGDQVGEVPVAQVLDQEMRAWIDAGAPGARFRPTPTIPHLVDWLAKRLDWACDHYPGIDAFAAAVQRVRGQMAGALGDFDPQAEQCEGVPCDRCDLRMLFRRQDGTGDVECQNPDCLKVFTAAQYRELVAAEAADERAQRDPLEVAELMRLRPRRTADLRPV